MKTAVFKKAGLVAAEETAKPTIQADDDVIIKVIRTCVCGSDLWAYRGLQAHNPELINDGHEALGIVEETSSAITTVKKGDFVIAPFTHGCGHCEACLAGYDGVCLNHKQNFSANAQAEYMRFPHGQWALVKVPGKPEDYTEDMIASLLTLADVMATGYHAARTANVQPGDTALVIGDGAVGLCGVISAKLRGAKQIILMSHHEDRAAIGKDFGATEIVSERDDAAIEHVMQLTNNAGADAVLECVGAEQSTHQAIACARPGAKVGRVGLPHGSSMDPAETFYRNVQLAGGPASVTTYDKQKLLKAVLDGQINPGRVFTKSYSLDEINQAYQDMANRKTIKALIKMY